MDPHDEVIEQRVGQTVGGRWILRQLIGAGGMAAVYAAEGPGGQLAAVKLLHPEMACRREIRERFVLEAAVMTRIAHPSMVTVLDHGQGSDATYLVMELLSGESLADRVRRVGRLPADEVLFVLDQILDVLVLAHSLGIIHRDLKPENLFLTREGRIKVLDFGLARLLEAGPNSFRTRTGAALGTLPYMAPEQALGRRDEIDARTDVFAVGATAYRLLSGRRVHEAPSEAELLMCMASEPAKPLLSVAPELHQGVGLVVDRALAFNKSNRYPDAATMQRDVRDLISGRPPAHATDRWHHDQSATKAERALPRQVAAMSPPSSTTRPLHEDHRNLPIPGSAAARQIAPTAHDPPLAPTRVDTGPQPQPPGVVPSSRGQLPATLGMMPAIGASNQVAPGDSPAFAGASIPIAPLSDAVLERRRKHTLMIGFVTLLSMSGVAIGLGWYLLNRATRTDGATAKPAVSIAPAPDPRTDSPHVMTPLDSEVSENTRSEVSRPHRRRPPASAASGANLASPSAMARPAVSPVVDAGTAQAAPAHVAQFASAASAIPIQTPAASPGSSPASSSAVASASHVAAPAVAPPGPAPIPDPNRRKKPPTPKQHGHWGR